MDNNEVMQNPEIEAFEAAIAEENVRLNEIYTEIGRLYAEKHTEDYESDFNDLMASVAESKAKIAENQAEIDKINGMVRCEVCGVASPNNVAFCSSCGAKLPGAAAPAVLDENKIPCMACGNLVDKTFAFCTACGKSVADSLNYLSGAYKVEAQPVAEAQPVYEAQPVADPQFDYEPSVSMETQFIDTPPSFETQNTHESVAPEAAKCPICGAALMEGALFCTECGTRL